jgi:flagellar L-ring protein precursor FlgH
MKNMSKSASDFSRSHERERVEEQAGERPLLVLAGGPLAHARGYAALLLALVAASSITRADSLWPAAGSGSQAGMVADRKANAKGDILTILIVESAAATSSQSKKSSRDSNVADAISQFIFSPAASGLLTHNGAMPATSLAGKASYSGGGDVSNTQSLVARAAVLVTDVLPNGNLVIEGVRVVTFSGETQYVVLHGLARPDDIARDNTVQSSNIADARVEFYSEGSITDAQKRGWLTKVYEKLRPL